MSHTNVIHHFGSAAELRSALMASMIGDRAAALDEVTARVRADAAVPRRLVDRVFDAFAQGGAGQLAAWIAVGGERRHLGPIKVAVRELVAAVGERILGMDGRVRAAVMMLAICAFGDAAIGPDIRPMLDASDDAIRTVTARVLVSFLRG